MPPGVEPGPLASEASGLPLPPALSRMELCFQGDRCYERNPEQRIREVEYHQHRGDKPSPLLDIDDQIAAAELDMTVLRGVVFI